MSAKSANTPAKPELLFRTAEINREALKPESREIELSFASEQPVERYDWDTGGIYLEVLDHSSEKSADFSRLNNGGALLRDHDRRIQIGVVSKGTAKIADDKKSRATVRFSRSPLGEQELQDVKDGIRTLVSVAYNVGREISREKKDGVEIRRYEWAPYEISTVAIPADTTVGIGRHLPGVDDPASADIEVIAKNLTPENKMKLRALLDPNPANREAGGAAAPAVDEGKIRSAAVTSYKEARAARVKEINATLGEYEKDFKDYQIEEGGKKVDLLGRLRQLGRECEESESDNESALLVFGRRAFAESRKALPPQKATMEALGFDEQDRGSYSLVRAIQNCLARGKTVPDPETLEGAAHVRMEKLGLGVDYNGFLVPPDANISPRSLSRSARRDLTATNFNQGGASVATDMVLPIIEILRNKMVTDKLGVRTLAGLQGNVVIPRQTAAATAQSLAETAALAISTQALDQIALTPKRVGAMNRYSKQLLLQSSMDVENFIREDLLRVIALDWDRLTLNGSGAGSEPLGVMNTPGINIIVFGAAATFAKLVSFETAIAVLNAPSEGRAYATTSRAKGVLKTAALLLTGATTVAARALWENDQINGYMAIDSQQIPNDQMVFGAWSEVIRGLWGGFDVVIDPYTAKNQAEVEIAINTFGDVALRHPQSFASSADSAAQ